MIQQLKVRSDKHRPYELKLRLLAAHETKVQFMLQIHIMGITYCMLFAQLVSKIIALSHNEEERFGIK